MRVDNRLGLTSVNTGKIIKTTTTYDPATSIVQPSAPAQITAPEILPQAEERTFFQKHKKKLLIGGGLALTATIATIILTR